MAIDFRTLLGSDPILRQALSGINAQTAASNASLDEQRRRYLVQYGGVPDSLPGGYQIDPLTQQLAQQATQGGLSTLAQLQHAYNQAQSASVGDLAARGIIHSGAYGQHANENLYNYNVSQAQAQQQLFDTINGLRQNQLAQQQQAVQQGQDATQAGVDRIIAQINAGTIGGGGAPPAPKTKMHAAPTVTGGRPYSPFQVVPNRGRALL